MIEAAFVRTMARYNSWQNKQLTSIVKAAPDSALTEDRGAFFGSIHGTLNHLLWGDRLWMSRFDPSVESPSATNIADGTRCTPTMSVWGAERFFLDGKISHWANSLSNVDLVGDLIWYSSVLEQTVSKPIWICITHFLNHQTHHRGQVHAMLTSAGLDAPVSDLAFMPEDIR